MSTKPKKPKLAVDWEINGVMTVRAIDSYGDVYRVKKPLRLAFRQVMKLGMAGKDGGQPIIKEGYRLKNDILEIEGDDWDKVMEDLETAVIGLGDYGHKIEVEPDEED